MTQVDPALERVQEHVERVREFSYHLMVYLLVNAMMVVLDLRDGSLDWAYWLIIGWGFGIAGHAIYVLFGDYRVHKLYERPNGRR